MQTEMNNLMIFSMAFPPRPRVDRLRNVELQNLTLFGDPVRGVAWSILECARRTRGVRDRALREHRRSSGSIPSSVPRAGGRPGYPVSSLFEEPPNPRLNLVQPLAQVGLKHIGLGLHHHALGLELVLEHHQLGE